MDRRRMLVQVAGALALASFAATLAAKPAPEDAGSIVIVLKNGKQQSFSLADVARIEFNTGGGAAMVEGRARFLGVWTVGDGAGGTFTITLRPDGSARKSNGSPRGTWTVQDGEARISWDDGWHDALRRSGGSYQKIAYAPGKSFGDEPSNVADARKHAEPN